MLTLCLFVLAHPLLSFHSPTSTDVEETSIDGAAASVPAYPGVPQGAAREGDLAGPYMDPQAIEASAPVGVKDDVHDLAV